MISSLFKKINYLPNCFFNLIDSYDTQPNGETEKQHIDVSFICCFKNLMKYASPVVFQINLMNNVHACEIKLTETIFNLILGIFIDPSKDKYYHLFIFLILFICWIILVNCYAQQIKTMFIKLNLQNTFLVVYTACSRYMKSRTTGIWHKTSNLSTQRCIKSILK